MVGDASRRLRGVWHKLPVKLPDDRENCFGVAIVTDEKLVAELILDPAPEVERLHGFRIRTCIEVDDCSLSEASRIVDVHNATGVETPVVSNGEAWRVWKRLRQHAELQF